MAYKNEHLGTNGFGAQEHDFETFDMLDPVAQSGLINDGMEAVVLERIAKELLDVPLQTIVRGLGLAVSTVQRKLKNEERLSPTESDRVARLLLIFRDARIYFGDPALAAEWLKRPLAGLNQVRPLEMLDTQPGYDRVRDILMRVISGVAA